ncbi:OLC1v1019812C1 [Oldenlandia corymbosa var. corymbosa]|uniref:OLC1v1019812C1 n=1 Tax=Oldenlandia corymbosa var. corymbosa TaxID=529605 RepID=A0AAV1EF55_OLDCO|nr:OLC1v1019812C1 [Oldenlandia corymbosa var. corymbosa]
MMRAVSLAKLARRYSQLGLYGNQVLSQHTMVTRSSVNSQSDADVAESWDSQLVDHGHHRVLQQTVGTWQAPTIGEKISRTEKIQNLVKALNDLDNNKEAIYSTLDGWVAWEKNFPIGPLKQALLSLERDQQWHKIIQVIKWMLSKGQGNTMGTYRQLIRALDMDHRAKEAHEFWMKKIGSESHSVPWELCQLMISIYYRNDMLQELVKLFKGLESLDRKPPDKSIVQKVADTYEKLGKPEEKERVLAKYAELFAAEPEKSKRKKKRYKKRTSDENKENP